MSKKNNPTPREHLIRPKQVKQNREQLFDMCISKFFKMTCLVIIGTVWNILDFDVAAVRGQDNFELNEQTFNQWVFSSTQGSFSPDSEVSLHVEAVERVCGLTDSQKAKLLTAAHGDFARFSHQVDNLRAKYVGKSYSQNEIGQIYQKFQPLSQAYQAGLLGDNSLFSKVLARTLTLEQAAKFDEIEAARARSRYAAKIGLFVVTLDRRCAFTEKQRADLVELLLAETKPPKTFGQYDWYVIMYQAGKVPDEKYEQIVDAAQMRQIKRTLQQGAGMQHFLRQQKLID